MEVFTPLNETKTERLRFERESVKVISGSLDVRGHGKKAVVEIQGKRYGVYGISCGLSGCICDAYIKEVTV